MNVMLPMLDMNQLAMVKSTKTTKQIQSEHNHHSFHSLFERLTNNQQTNVYQTIDINVEQLEENLLNQLSNLISDDLELKQLDEQQLYNDLQTLLTLPEDMVEAILENVSEALKEVSSIEHNEQIYEIITVVLIENASELKSSAIQNHATFDNENKRLSKWIYTLAKLHDKNIHSNQTNQINVFHLIEKLSEWQQFSFKETTNPKILLKWEQMMDQLKNELSLTRQPIISGTQFIKIIEKTINQINLQQGIAQQVNIPIHFNGPMTPLEQYTIFVNHTTNQPTINQSHMIEQLQQMILSSRFGQINGTNHLTIQLKPNHLGDLTIRFMEQDGQMIVKMIVQSKGAKELLEANIHQLRHMFAPNQVIIERQYQEQSFSLQQENVNKDEENTGEQHQKHSKQNDNEQEKQETKATFKDYLFHEEV